MKGLFNFYEEFADHARSIKGYGDWTYTCKKAFDDFNEWIAVDGIPPVTQFEMQFLESMYRFKHRNDESFE